MCANTSHIKGFQCEPLKFKWGLLISNSKPNLDACEDTPKPPEFPLKWAWATP